MSIDISKLTREQLEQYIHIQKRLAEQQEEADKVTTRRAYYDGEHPVMLTERQKEYLGTLLTGAEFEFAHNVVKTVVDMLNDRLCVNGVTVNGKGAGSLDDPNIDAESYTAALFWQWWSDWRMDAQQDRLYKRVLRDSASFIMVDYDTENKRPRATLHKLDDGNEGIVYHRDPADANRVLFAVRYFWETDPFNPTQLPKERKTVYLPGEIRKYMRDAGSPGGWRQYMDVGDDTWPLPWRDLKGRPLGVAVIEFQDPEGGIVDGIVGLQNGINKGWLDLLAAADMAGFPIVALEYDKAPNPAVTQDDSNQSGDDELLIAPGHALEVFGGKAKRLEAANLGSMLEVIWALVSAVALVSRMPQHEFKPLGSVQFPSGESLKQAESGLVTKAEKRQVVFGQGWSDVFALARRVEHTFGSPMPELKRVNIGTQWRDPNTRMKKVESEVAQSHKELGVPDVAVWKQAGYSPEEIAEFQQNKRLEDAAKVAAIAGAVRQSQATAAAQTTTSNQNTPATTTERQA